MTINYEINLATNKTREKSIMDIQENDVSELISINVICRLCAKHNDKLIGIYSENGINNDLANKMNMYLSIKVNETDNLPLQCCWQCVSTVLAWHDLVITSVEADRTLRSYQFATENQLHDETSLPAEESCYSEKQDEFMGKCGEIEQEYILYDPMLQDSNSETILKKSLDITFTCALCCKIFDTKLYLNKHMKEIHNMKLEKHRRKKNEIDATFTCPICQKCYTRKFDMQKHMKHKHPDQAIAVNPSNRSKNVELLAQCKVVSLEGSYYKCDICGQSFNKSYSFLRHKNIHNRERMFCCHICGKKFIVSGALVRHINQHHYGIKKFSCNVCGRKFCAKSTRDEHMNIHNDIRPFVCDICGKSFKQNSSLHIHKMFHTDIFPFSCSICNKKFRRNRDLKVHQWTHTGEKPHPCNQCNMSFRLKQDLKIHLKVHADYFCDVCGLEFQQERFLKNHIAIHEK